MEGAHLFLYDGVCGLCDHVVQIVLQHDTRGAFTFASLQSAVGKEIVERFGANPDELTTFFVLADYHGKHARLLSRSRAALFVARELGWPWKAAAVMRVLPTAILDRLYDFVARHRYRVFGRLDRCLVPRSEFRGRFLDAE